ncbi:hypothetical protein YC2023_118252 [Brassica napus]
MMNNGFQPGRGTVFLHCVLGAYAFMAKASLDSALLLAFDLTQRTDSQFMSMIRYAINHIVKFTIKCCSHSTLIQATVYKHLIKGGSIYSISDKKWGKMARKICLDDVEVKLGELEAELFVIKAINDNLGHIESGRDPENYLKYSVQDIEIIVLDFFEEYTHVTPAKLEKTMKEEDWRGNKDSVVQINGVGDMNLKSLLKDGFVFGHDFLQVVAAVHIGWILLFVFICGIKFLNFQKKVKEKRTFVP